MKLESNFKNSYCSGISKSDYLLKIEKSLNRMRQRNHHNTKGYQRLMDLYLAVHFNRPFVIHDVTEQIISETGGLIRNFVKSDIFLNKK